MLAVLHEGCSGQAKGSRSRPPHQTHPLSRCIGRLTPKDSSARIHRPNPLCTLQGCLSEHHEFQTKEDELGSWHLQLPRLTGPQHHWIQAHAASTSGAPSNEHHLADAAVQWQRTRDEVDHTTCTTSLIPSGICLVTHADKNHVTPLLDIRQRKKTKQWHNSSPLLSWPESRAHVQECRPWWSRRARDCTWQSAKAEFEQQATARNLELLDKRQLL